ncbi:polyketide synthase, partial [Peltigera leucophlebia]|nr:polyketide synthase [Peltigera leucophlebia]
FLSPDGKSYAFDNCASGYGRGEGVSTIIMKPLESALRDGDPIRAAIKNIAINQDGKTRTTTSPSQKAQEELIWKCYRDAGIEPSSAAYVEAHGTGTQAGDLAEAGAIAATCGQKRPLERPLFIGSIKTNIGHLEPASGFASVLKIALALEKGFIPPSINFEIPPTLHDLHFSRPKIEDEAVEKKNRVFVLSGKDEIAARSMTSNLQTYLRNLGDSCLETMLDNLAYAFDALEYSAVKPTRSLDQPRLGCVFTGQGAQWYAMGRELIKAYPLFKNSLCEADKYLKNFGASWSLMNELMKDKKTSLVNDAILSPPLCVAVQISIVRLLSSWNVKPTAVTSHSSGEVAAAYTAGVIDLQEAMAIVYSRGIHLEALRKNATFHGGMIAVDLGRESTKSYISMVKSGQAIVACVNSPSSITFSGDLVAIEELEVKLTSDNVFVRRLKVDVAYHSHHMKPLKDNYLKSLCKVLKQSGGFSEILYSSPVTGGAGDICYRHRA